jgi:hypothetical protein
MAEKKLKYAHSFDHRLLFESYGVTVAIEATDGDLLKEAESTAHKALVNRLTIIENGSPDHIFSIGRDPDGTFRLLKNGEELSYDTSLSRFFKFFNSMLRIAVAEHAEERVFVHAGVVGWKGRAIIIPAYSFRGKTTLVAELVKNGAQYYSDEYAVLDVDGRVHPFERSLSVRDENYAHTDVPIEGLGGDVGSEPIPVGLVVITEFEAGATWNPEKLTLGRGIMEVIPHTISRNFNTVLSLKVLNTALSDAIILKSSRGDALGFAPELLAFFDKYINLDKMT